MLVVLQSANFEESTVLLIKAVKVFDYQMKEFHILKSLLIDIIIGVSILNCTVAIADSAFAPGVAGSRSATADDVKAIKDRLIHASTMQELVSALR